MKRIWIAVVLVAVIITACIFEYNTTVKMHYSITQHISDISGYIESADYEKANYALQQTEEHWAKYKKNLSVFISHDTLNQTDLSLAKMKSNIDSKDQIDALSEANTIQTQIDEIMHMEEVYTENLL